MRQIFLNRAGAGPDPKTARLTRHLEARLRDFGPGGPEILSSDQDAGRIAARFPGHDAGTVLGRLEKEGGVSARLEGDTAVFYLTPDVRFEELDYLWGCLFELLA